MDRAKGVSFFFERGKNTKEIDLQGTMRAREKAHQGGGEGKNRNTKAETESATSHVRWRGLARA